MYQKGYWRLFSFPELVELVLLPDSAGSGRDGKAHFENVND